MKKFIALLFIVSILITSCGANAPTATAEPAATSEVKTPSVKPTPQMTSNIKVGKDALRGLEIMAWTPWYGVESSLFDSLVKEFNQKNEWGIKVSAASQGNFSNLFENTTASLSKKEQPDLVIALPEHALEWDADGAALDLTAYVGDPLYGMDAGDIPAVFWNQDYVNKKRVAIPAQRNARLLLWNKTWAKELGFSSAPNTPDDFRRQACGAQQFMLKDAAPQNDFMGGWLVDTEPMTAYAWMLAFEGGVLEGSDYRFLTPKNIEAFKFLRELSEKSCAWQTADADPIAAFAAREALFVTVSLEDLPNAARAFASANSADKWEALAFPGANENALIIYGSSYVVLKSTDEKQLAAWLFARWLLEEKQDARFVEATHLFPIRAASMDLLGDYKKTHPQWAQAVDLLARGEMQPQLASWRKVKTMLGDGFAHMYNLNIPSGQVAVILAQMESISRELGK
ncbi:MAG: extracellular solute-binding protein [Anaerolineales bacterium]|nr:extracellular solute-binding protein [Anaerolineales bacterium]